MKVTEQILQMTPYRPGKPISETQREYNLKTVHKLASNENPLGPSPLAIEAMKKALQQQHLYPDAAAYEMLSDISQRWSVPLTQLSVGNGSDEIIDLLTRIYCEPGEGVLTSQLAFQAYQVSSAANRLKLYETPLTQDWRFDLKAMADMFLHHPEYKIKLIFVANPNNPTGTYNSKKEMEDFFQRLGNRDDVLLIFDEAYTEFVRAQDYTSALPYVQQVSNLLVMKTFSKVYGLAGLRAGVLVAPKSVIEVYNRVRKPFNLNDLAQVAVKAALGDHQFLEQTKKLTWSGVDFFQKWFAENKIPYLPSQANFVLFDTQRDAMKVYEELLKRGLIVRPLPNYGLKTHLRLSVGTEEQNQFAVRMIEEVFSIVPRLSS